MRSIGWIETLMPFGVAVSAALHGTILGVALLGWPILTFLTDNDWFSPDDYVRIDVVLYSEKEHPEVAKGKGVVSFDTETIGKGQAQSSGRAFGPLASHSRLPLTKPNAIARQKSGPAAPSKSSETAKTEATALARRETAETKPTETAQARETASANPGVKSSEPAEETGEAEKSNDSSAGRKRNGRSEARGMEAEVGRKGTDSSSAPPSNQASAKTGPNQGQVADDDKTARAEAAQSENLSPDRPKGREDATAGATADGAEAGLAEAAARDGATTPDAGNADAAGQRTTEATREPEHPPSGATFGAEGSTAERHAETSGASVAARAATDAEQAPPPSESESRSQPSPEESDRESEPARSAGDARPNALSDIRSANKTEPSDPPAQARARPEMRLILASAVLDLTTSMNASLGMSETRPLLPPSENGVPLASQAELGAIEPVPQRQAPSERQEERPAPTAQADSEAHPVETGNPGGRVPLPNAAPQLAQASPSQIRDIPLRMLVETMPGVDSDLVQAIEDPASVPEQPASARRQKVIDRIAAAAERGYVHAQYGMARRYLLGQGVPRDPAAGAQWLQQAAEQGHVPSQLLLGYLAARGYGRDENMADAMLWWSLAADAGDPNAASAVRITEPTLDPRDLLEARRNISSWRAAFGQVEETASIGGDNTPESTPLQEAVAAGDLPEVRSVLARGEDAEGRDIDGRTALINASWRGDANITETLLEVGADPDIVDHDGKSALIWAASNGNLSVTALLADAGAELDTQDKQGLSALIRAAWNGHTKVVEALLKAGADTRLKDNNGLTALDHASRENYDDIVALLKAATN